MTQHRLSDAEFSRMAEDARNRHNLSDIIGRHTELKRAGRELVGICLFHSEKSPSMRVNDAKGFYHCFGCGSHGDAIRFVMDYEGRSFMEALRWLGDADLPIVAPEDRIRAAAEDAAASARSVADAGELWERCVDPVGTPAQIYALSRGITAPLPMSIRFGMVPAGKTKAGEWRDDLPAMVGGCFNEGGDLVAIQRIFLRNGGRAKAQMQRPKLSLGRVRGSALRLGPVAAEIILCEGPEDGLTLMQELPGASVWVALGTGLMPFVEFPADVRSVVLAGDNNDAGRMAIAKAGEALALRGVATKTMFPDPAFSDFNDQLRGIRI